MAAFAGSEEEAPVCKPAYRYQVWFWMAWFMV